MSIKFYIKQDLDSRVVVFDQSTMQFKLGCYAEPTYFESYAEAEIAKRLFQNSCEKTLMNSVKIVSIAADGEPDAI